MPRRLRDEAQTFDGALRGAGQIHDEQVTDGAGEGAGTGGEWRNPERLRAHDLPEPGQLAVLFLDLDRFKSFNDRLGHGAGDEVLLRAARGIAGAVRPPDTVARMGGDEFVVLLEHVHDEHDAMTVARRIATAVAAPVSIGGHDVELTMSIGIAMTTQATEPDSLIRAADTAMYRAKDRGRNRCEIITDWLPDSGVIDDST